MTITGSAFISSIRHLPRLPDREEAIFAAVAGGGAVEWPWVRVGAVEVAADYLAIGTIDDFVRVPCSGPLALRVAAELGGRLPTEEEVDAIWAAADVRLVAEPWGERPTPDATGAPMPGNPYGALMLTVERFVAHEKRIDQALAKHDMDLLLAGDYRDHEVGSRLIEGHKKTVLGVRRARAGDYLVHHGQAVVGVTDVLAFYGWQRADGTPIQHDDGAHPPDYADYSHGVRVVRDVDPDTLRTGAP